MLRDFRDFIMRGNVFDLAIGVIIGTAFGKIVDSLVKDLFMPLLSVILGGLDFSNYFIALSRNVTASSLEEARKQGAVLAYGNFITILVNFLIIAALIFALVRLIALFKRSEAPAPTQPSKQETLLEEIRDLLAKKS
jgi:large conductance mechanosensitive channel